MSQADGGKGKELYRSAGVDVDKGDRLVDWLQDSSGDHDRRRGEVVSGIGGFAALYRPNLRGMSDPLIISSTDGVGTKLLLGIENKQLTGLGIDLVAMCVNDLYCVGGAPMFFLDYFATGKLDEKQFQDVLTGIKAGLKKCETALIGGETAELPGLYGHSHFDLAGFVVGIVDRPKMLSVENVREGDVIFGLKSSGFHSNGYSLLRRWLKDNDKMRAFIDRLLIPTQIYAEMPEILSSVPQGSVKAIAHITGGGISGNVERVIPNGLCANIQLSKIQTPDWMLDVFKLNQVSRMEVESTFNLGMGLSVVVDPTHASEFEKRASQFGNFMGVVGTIQRASDSEKVNISE